MIHQLLKGTDWLYAGRMDLETNLTHAVKSTAASTVVVGTADPCFIAADAGCRRSGCHHSAAAAAIAVGACSTMQKRQKLDQHPAVPEDHLDTWPQRHQAADAAAALTARSS